MKPKEVILDVGDKNESQPQENNRQPQENDRQPSENDSQPYENDSQPHENDRQKRDRVRRQLLEEAKNKQLEKKMKKTARRKARNKKLPSVATLSDQTSARSPPAYTTLSNGCCMEKEMSSLQIDESMMSSDAFYHHKPLHLGNVDILTNIDVNKSEDGITVRKHQDNMMLESAEVLKEGQELLETHVSSTSAVPQHLQAVSSFTLPVCGHCCLMSCKFLGDDDAVSPCNLDSAENCGTNQPFCQNTDQTTLHNEDAPILKCMDSDQPSIPCLSLLPSSSASDLFYIHQEAETDILSCLHKPQFQNHLPLNVGSMQLQRSLIKIILSHLLSQYYPETDTSEEDLKHKHGIVPYSKFLSQNFQQSRLQVMQTKSLSGSVFFALMDMRYYQKNFISWPSLPVLKDICQMFFSHRRSSLKKCNATSSAKFKVQVAERVCEASPDKISVAVDRNIEVCSLTAADRHADLESCQYTHNCTSDEVLQNVESYSLTAADRNPYPESNRGSHSETSDEVLQIVESCSLTATDRDADLESCQDTHNCTDEVLQNVESYSLTVADRHADLESCQDTHNYTSDEVLQNVESYSLTAEDRNPGPESHGGSHSEAADEVLQNVESYSLTAEDRNPGPESHGGSHSEAADEVLQNVESYSLTAADGNKDLESCKDTCNCTSDEVLQIVESYLLTAADLESCQDTRNCTSDEVLQIVESYLLTAADRHADLESCQDTHNCTSDEVLQNVESYSSTAADRNPHPESSQGQHNRTSDDVSQNFKDYSLTATDLESCQDAHDTADEVPQNVGYSTFLDRNPYPESCRGTENYTSDEVPQNIESHTSDTSYFPGEQLLNERKVASDLWCPIRQEFVPDNWDDDISSDEDVIDSTSICVMTDSSISTPAPTTPRRTLFVESCIESDNNEKHCTKQQFLDVEISEQNSSCYQEVVNNITSVCDKKPKQTTDSVRDVRELDKRKCWDGNDQATLSMMTVPLLPHTTVMNTQQHRKTKCLHQEHQLVNKPELKLHQSTDLGSFSEAETNKSNEEVWLTPVSNQSQHQRLHTAEVLTNAINQLNDTDVGLKAEQSESMSYLNKTFGTLQNSSDMKNIIEDGVVNKGSELDSSNYPAGSSKNYIPADFVNLKEVRIIDDGRCKCELWHNRDIIENSLPSKCVTDSSISVVNSGRNCSSHNIESTCELNNNVHRKWEFIPDNVLKEGTAEASVNRLITEHECQQHEDEFLREHLMQGNSDRLTYANQQIYNSTSLVNNELTKSSVHTKSSTNNSPHNTIHPTLLHPSSVHVASSNLCHLPTKSDLSNFPELRLNISNNPVFSSTNCIPADFVNLTKVRLIDDGKCELWHNRDIVENSLPSKCVPDIGAVVNSGRNCSHNIESACELNNSVHRKWEFIPDNVLKEGTAEASVNRLITDHECQQHAVEFLRERLMQGNSDSLTYAEYYANKQIYNSALAVNNEATKSSVHTTSSTNNSAQKCTTIHPALLHPSTFQVASNNLCHEPTKSDLNKLLALTLQKKQEHLYLLLSDLQAKVLTLARMMKAHKIMKSPLPAGDDIDSFKSAGLLPGEAELSLEKIEAILNRFVLVANTCLIPAPEHTSAKSVQWNKRAQCVQNMFPLQCDKREKQTDQRELSGLEVDNILERLHMLGINDLKTPHTRGQSTAHSVNQSSQVGSLNSDRYFQNRHLPSRLPEWPPEGFEQKYWLGKASKQLQTRVPHNKKTNKAVSLCQDGASQFIPCYGSNSRNSADVTWNMQELQGQMQSGNQRKSNALAGSFTTADSPCNSTQEKMTNISKNMTPYKLLRRRMIRMSDHVLGEKKDRETETHPDLGEVALPTEIGHSPPDFREPSKSFSSSTSALPVLRKNVAMQKTKSSHYSCHLPSVMERPVLAVSKTLPKKAGEFNSKDGW